MTLLDLSEEMSIARLRKDHPQIEWSVDRHGFAGVAYRGVGTGVDVIVVRVSSLWDELGSETGRWHVYGYGAKHGSELYALWMPA